MSDESLSPKQQGQIATLAGFIAPLIGILLMVVLGLVVDVVVGIIVGAVAVLVLVPLTQRILKRRAGS
ncbi:MAG: hypothetical protein OXI41_02465 [Chloroflexota bacterium]|nr:hypothetical protein [Chloroflexota bacterium]MDE2896015.1 hypothetical protein [Chloroflexota bacterium]